jgi:hypothetical protein
VPPVSKALWVERLRLGDEFGGEDVYPVLPAREPSEALSETDAVEGRRCLVEVEADAVVEIAPVVVATSVVEEWHRLTRQSAGVSRTALPSGA